MCLFLGVFDMPTMCPIALILSIFSKCQFITKVAVDSFEKALRVRNAITGMEIQKCHQHIDQFASASKT